MLLDIPGTCWSQKHANALDLAATLTFAPLSMFGGLSPHATQAGPASATATNSGSGGSATDRWNAAIAAKMKTGCSRQTAAVMVVKEQPQLQAAYIQEFRQQAAKR